jgi:hypothetical protein
MAVNDGNRALAFRLHGVRYHTLLMRQLTHELLGVERHGAVYVLAEKKCPTAQIGGAGR